jgi:hypothetical protein
VVLPIHELSRVVENLLTDFHGRVSFETLCAELRACADDHPAASGPAVEQLTRFRLRRDHLRHEPHLPREHLPRPRHGHEVTEVGPP